MGTVRPRSRCSPWAAVLVAAAALSAVATAVSISPAQAQTGPAPNPPVADSCGIDVALVLDASGSISSSNAVDDVRDAGEAFLDALADTGSNARVLQFATLSEELAGLAEVTEASLQPGGVFRDAIDDYYNPKPPRPGNVNIYSYRGSGNPQSSGSWNQSNGSNQYTNWDQSLREAGEEPSELVLYITDGDPTGYDFDQAGDPFDAGPPPDVGVNTDRGSAADVTLDRAVEEADAIKSDGTRILAVGVGSALQNTSSRNRLIQIAGPQVVDDADLPTVDSINDVDVALVEDFEDLARFLRGVVSQLCSPSLSIRKLAQTPASAEYTNAPGWDITVAPSVPAGGFDWILPDTDAAQLAGCDPLPGGAPSDEQPRTCTTNASGIANFQWEPDPPEAATSAVVTETLLPGYTAGRPGADPDSEFDDDFRCQIKDIEGVTTIVAGELDGSNSFDLDVDSQDIITCTIWNSFDYTPAIDIVKVNDPTIVRGDLPPDDRLVTSTYSVSIPQPPGNTPLDDVAVTDAALGQRSCSPVGFVGGDTNGNDQLDLDETWTFQCATPAPTASGTYVNTATASGTDPNGEDVSDTASDDVDVVDPGIELTKLVSGGGQGPGAQITVPINTPVTYTFDVDNTGDTVLDLAPAGVYATPADQRAAARLTDRIAGDPGCSPITYASGDTDDDGFLDTAEVWTFTCDATAPATQTIVLDTATVTATPVIPGYTGPNPDITDSDSAEVDVEPEGIVLAKTVDPTLVFPGGSVTYTYAVSLDVGSVTLRPSDADGNPVPRLNWVTDPRCTSPTYDSGDVGDDSLLEAGETWLYLCTKTLDIAAVNVPAAAAEVNVATVLGHPDLPADPVQVVRDDDAAVAFLLVPLVDVVKTASRDTVLDPPTTCPPATLSCEPVLGPDAPTPRTVDYTFDVYNRGQVDLDLAPVGVYATPADQRAAARIVDTVDGAPFCSPEYVSGDDDDDGVIQPDEVWTFECADVTLTKADTSNGFNVVDTVEVTANGLLPGVGTRSDDVVASDDENVQVLTPNLALTKTPSATLVRPGTEVTYTYEVTNTGDPVGFDVLGVVDDSCSPVTFVSGDVLPPAGNDLLQVGETWVYTCSVVLDSPDDPLTPAVENEVTNVALVGAFGPLGNLYLRNATATVQVFDPAITLTKVVDDDFVPVGAEVSYTFTVTNSGADVTLDELTDILLADVAQPALPSCTSPTLTDQGDGDDVLSVGEVWTYGCSATVQADTVNIAGVRGTDIGDGFVFDVAGAYVAVYEAGIQVEKTADPTELLAPGGPVTYTYEVTNTGNVPLADVADRITDDTCSPVTYVDGDLDENDLLTGEGDLFETGPPEVWTFTCLATVTEDTTNTVVVAGTPVSPGGPDGPESLGPDVTDDDSATVVVVPIPLPPTPTTTVPRSTTTTIVRVLPDTGGGTSAVPVAWAVLAAGLVLVVITRRRRPA